MERRSIRHSGARAFARTRGPSPEITNVRAGGSGDGPRIGFAVRGDGITSKRKGYSAHPGESRDPYRASLGRYLSARSRAGWVSTFEEMTAGDALRRKIIALSLGLIAIISAGCETSTTQEAATSFSDADARPSLCLAPSSFQGCCSWNLGMKYFEGARLICKNNNPSPTCSKPKTADLRGCCSGYGGIKNIELSGIVTCRRGTSPNCRLETCSL